MTDIRIFDFNVFSEKQAVSSDDDESNSAKPDASSFTIQMFGIDENGKTCSIIVEDFKPFFYVLVDDAWKATKKAAFLEHIKAKMGAYYKDSITECIIVKRKKLYGFDEGKEHKFVKFEFSDMNGFNKAKNFWYSDYQHGHYLLRDGYKFGGTNTRLYEANIPPLLRFFHVQDISPSGWVSLPKSKTIQVEGASKKTSCDFEYLVSYKNIIALNNKETRVKYKIMSFDIEASSSHGDFPVPVKTYKKLCTNIMEYIENLQIEHTPDERKYMLERMVKTAFGQDNFPNIDRVFPKKQPQHDEVENMCKKWLTAQVRDLCKSKEFDETATLESFFERMGKEQQGDDEEDHTASYYAKQSKKADKKATIADIIFDPNVEREEKLKNMNESLNAHFPKLEGDKVTFIGSTFMNYGESDPYMNHCITLNKSTPVEGCILEHYSTEREVLLAWQKLVQRENPDIIIGYNIFGFDYNFMFQRAEENDCIEEFLKLSRNQDEVCATRDKDTGRYKMEESSIQIASGQHELKFIKINGRLQVDLYNFFRREENLTSYKLDYVAGHFIGDYVKSITPISGLSVAGLSVAGLSVAGLSVARLSVAHSGDLAPPLPKVDKVDIRTSNMTGLLVGSFIHFEEIGHSVDYYDGGAKFQVTSINKAEGVFTINASVNPDMTKKVRWCLAKDDVSPKEIFEMTNGSDNDRSIIAKYCIQDCNLVHYLFNKADILTGFVEMAKICSVPINFLVMRGQGIKLTSFIAKKCREKRTLMPVIEKGSEDDGYEGAIVLDPKCDLYLDNPVACVDYASLYPSCIISENLSHDSKVWTKEYDLAGNLIEECGEQDKDGNFIYDNLPDYEYVNITYDTYRYIRKTPAAAPTKVKSGMKICRFAQFAEGRKAIMPSILEELLTARKTTRKLIPLETDEFMKNVLDKRQLGYKVTANSLYGGCGAKTCPFYEKDIAACTTATGRLLLIYAKKIVEECYGDSVCNTTSHGPVLTKAEYIYGDTDSVFFTFNLQTLEGKPIRGKEALEITIELAQEAGHLASSYLKGPHDLEYEKTFMPFCLLSKKRYVGMLYETDPNKCKRKEMGIVLKRRDNAPIVKDIYGGIIDILMKQQNIQQAIDFLRSSLQNLVEEKYPMDKLIITKSLRSGYKNPKSIAHKVLADRITARDPGNKPSSGDRIAFAYIVTKNKKALQGEKIETPAYITDNGLKLDYSFYITNQIMKPVQQVFALVLEKIWDLQNKKSKIANYKKAVLTLRNNTDEDKFEDKLEQLRNKEVKALLFDEYLREISNDNQGNQSLMKFFVQK